MIGVIAGTPSHWLRKPGPVSRESLMRAGEVTARYRVLKENTDFLDRLTDFPHTDYEAGQILAYYLRHAAAMSPVVEDRAYANAHRELSALLHRDLNPVYFEDAAQVGWHMHCRTAGYPLADGYQMWTDDELEDEYRMCINYMLDLAPDDDGSAS